MSLLLYAAMQIRVSLLTLLAPAQHNDNWTAEATENCQTKSFWWFYVLAEAAAVEMGAVGLVFYPFTLLSWGQIYALPSPTVHFSVWPLKGTKGKDIFKLNIWGLWSCINQYSYMKGGSNECVVWEWSLLVIHLQRSTTRLSPSALQTITVSFNGNTSYC